MTKRTIRATPLLALFSLAALAGSGFA